MTNEDIYNMILECIRAIRNRKCLTYHDNYKDHKVTKNDIRVWVRISSSMIEISVYDAGGCGYTYLHVRYDKESKQFMGDGASLQFAKSFLNSIFVLEKMHLL